MSPTHQFRYRLPSVIVITSVVSLFCLHGHVIIVINFGTSFGLGIYTYFEF